MTAAECYAARYHNGAFGQCFCGRFVYGVMGFESECRRCRWSMRVVRQAQRRASGHVVSIKDDPSGKYRVTQWRAVCSCGWVSAQRTAVKDVAREWALEHHRWPSSVQRATVPGMAEQVHGEG